MPAVPEVLDTPRRVANPAYRASIVAGDRVPRYVSVARPTLVGVFIELTPEGAARLVKHERQSGRRATTHQKAIKVGGAVARLYVVIVREGGK